MKYFKIAYNMFLNRLIFNIVLILEIAALIILSNITIASYNSKYILYKPYENILKGEGIVVCMDYAFDIINGKSEVPMTLDEIVGKLKGVSKVIVNSETYSEKGENNIGINSLLPKDEGYVDLMLIESDLLKNMKLPLEKGRWCSSELNKNGQIEVVVSAGTDAQLDKVYHTDFGDIVIVGILTDTTYEPNLGGYNRDETSKGIFCLYEDFDSNISLFGSFLLMDKQLFMNSSHEGWFINDGDNVLLVYDDNISDKEKNENIEYLESIGSIIIGNFHEMDERTNNTLNDILIKMIPIVLMVSIVVLSGFIGSSAISTLKNIKNFGIFFMCGCCWKDCFKIILTNLVIVFAVSGVLASGALILINMSMSSYMGLLFEWNNLIITLGLVLLVFLLSIILPYIMIRKTSPVETVKENAE